VWMMKGKFDEAIADFSHAIELDPTRSISYLNRGLALTVRGRDEEAKKDFEKCLALDPTVKADLEQRIAKAKDIRHALIVKN
jgi:lipoprotein NlpI